MSERFTEILRAASEPAWSDAVRHRFVKELFAGAVPDAVMARYLIQDHRFLDSFLTLLGATLATRCFATVILVLHRLVRFDGPIRCVRSPRHLRRSVGNLIRGHSVRNGGATGKRVIAKGRLPVPGNYELSAVQELGSLQKSPGKIGAIEHRLEEVGGLQMRNRQVRSAQVRTPEIGTPKIGPR